MTPASAVLAVALAAVGALFFGLASVRQHSAVQTAAPPARAGRWRQLRTGLRLVRQPSWLLGAGQAALGGGLHVLALTLAPITLVQPVGVLAVPVTVVASALARRRRPARAQVLGTVLSVAGVAAMTVVLLLPAAQPGTLPAASTLALATAVVVLGGSAVALLLGGAWAPLLLRCVARAVVAASLFGLNSVLIRTVGEVVALHPARPAGLVVASLVGIAVALPLGVWAMQSAYLVGSPQVVICCLTLVDPLTAVAGGRFLLQDGAAVTGPVLVAASACALVASAGVLLLARDFPVVAAPERLPALPPPG